MSNNTTDTTTSSKSRHSTIYLSEVITCMIVFSLLVAMSLFTHNNWEKKNALATTVINLQQARLAIQEYQTIYRTLPGIQGNKSVLSSKDILGFPKMTSEDNIKYIGTPTNTFCLVSKSPFLPYFQYITSASSKVYSVRPTTC